MGVPRGRTARYRGLEVMASVSKKQNGFDGAVLGTVNEKDGTFIKLRYLMIGQSGRFPISVVSEGARARSRRANERSAVEMPMSCGMAFSYREGFRPGPCFPHGRRGGRMGEKAN